MKPIIFVGIGAIILPPLSRIRFNAIHPQTQTLQSELFNKNVYI